MKTQNNQNPLFMFAGGGTGGHLYPAIAIAQSILRKWPSAYVEFVGTRNGLETRVIPEMGYTLHLIEVRGFKRKNKYANIVIVFYLIISLFQSLMLLMRTKPLAVVGTGGYVSGPVLFVAALMRIPTAIQEQNTFPGITTRLLARWVDQIYITFDETKQYLKKGTMIKTGNPIRELETPLSKTQAIKHFNIQTKGPLLFVFGGSQGARIINDTLLECIEFLIKETNLAILWSTGPSGYEKIRDRCISYADRIRVYPFIKEMHIAYKASDLVICRAGAITIAEVTASGLPSILIPLKIATANHQEKNARVLQASGAACVVTENELTVNRLQTEISELANDATRRKKMAESSRQLSQPNAAEDIGESLIQLVKLKKGI